MGEVMSPIWLSIKIAIWSTIIVMVLATFLASFLDKKHFPGKRILEAFLLVPMVLPPTVIGFGLIYLFGKNGPIGYWLDRLFDIQVYFSWIGAVIAAIIVSFPLMYQSAKAAFEKVDARWQNVARTMGASERKIFFTVTLPLAWPGLLAGIILTFARSIGEFGATLMIAGYIPGETDTLPLAIYFAVEAGEQDLAIIWTILLVTLGLATVAWLGRLSQRHTKLMKNR